MDQTRKSGILFPIASLPDPYGVGSFSKQAYHFVDLLSAGGFKLWQILPLNPLGYGHSPYQPFSSYAFDDLYIDLQDLVQRGYLEPVPPFHSESEKILYEDAKVYKDHFLRLSYEKQMELEPDCLKGYIAANPWIKLWAAFIMFKKSCSMASWDEWPVEKRDWIKGNHEIKKEDVYDYEYEIWLQMTLRRQWDSLHQYANSKGIAIIGDIPFYVGFDSLDVWSHQEAFLIDQATLKPTFVAGVPPDYFSKTGQRWGNPIYDWDYLKRTDFAFLQERIIKNSDIYDIIRLDHFRAFDTFWKVPSSCPTAMEGAWIEAPGYAFFDSLLKKRPSLSDQIIAEDLGDLRKEVLVLRDHYSFPGMNVAEFTFNDADVYKKPGVDWNRENMVVYLGTHDNDTMKGFYDKMKPEEQKRWSQTLDRLGYFAGDINERFIHYALDRKSRLAVFALQDILGLDSKARINVPGVIDDVNWTWRLTSFKALEGKVAHLAELNKEYGR